MEQDFYITLPSNVTSPYKQENTISNFVTKLPRRIQLSGQWEVGLAEISYSLSWYNIKKTCEVNLCTFQPDPSSRSNITFLTGNLLRAGRYDNLKDILHQIQEAAKKYMLLPSNEYPHKYEPPDITFDERSRKVTIKHGRNLNYLVYLTMERYLCEKLGIDYDSIKHEIKKKHKLYRQLLKQKRVPEPPSDIERTTVAERPIELNAGCKSLYIYSNIVKRSFVGNTMAPILRLVEVPSTAKFGDQVVIAYAAPHYVPITTNEFEIIEIDIKDDTDEKFLLNSVEQF